MEPVCYLNGAIIPLKDAKISILDLGTLRGFGIYEGITSFAGEPFHFDTHWERFEISAKTLGLTIPHTKEEVLSALQEIIRQNAPGTRANIRMVLTGGIAEGGIEHIPGRETLFATAEPAVPLPKELYEKGARLIMHEHQRFMPDIKTINYITAVTLQEKRKAANAIEILYTSGNQVLECATSNVFIVKDGAVITPDSGILKGVTRKVTLDLARVPYSVEEGPVLIDELLGADEVFITSSFKDIVPIVAVDDRTIGSGTPGPVTRDLMERFVQYAK